MYDSTLVVPVFYGVYTAAGFLDSLVRPFCLRWYHDLTLLPALDLQRRSRRIRIVGPLPDLLLHPRSRLWRRSAYEQEA